MNTDTRFLRDHFNSNSIMLIHSMEAHDIYVETLDFSDKCFGPPIRVYNWAGSGNPNSVALYEYLLALHQKYGSTEMFSPELDISVPFKSGENSIGHVIRDLPDEPHYLRVTDEKAFLGFQTYSDVGVTQSYGPLVRISKSLPLIDKETQTLSRSLGMNFDIGEPAL